MYIFVLLKFKILLKQETNIMLQLTTKLHEANIQQRELLACTPSRQHTPWNQSAIPATNKASHRTPPRKYPMGPPRALFLSAEEDEIVSN